MKKAFHGFAALMVVVILMTMCGFSAFAEEQVTLVFWDCYNAADETSIAAAWMKEAIETFEAQYPNVKIEEITTADGDDYLTKVTAELAAGNVPDMFRTWLTGRLQPFVEAGYVYPLNELVDASPVLSQTISANAKGYSSYGDDTFYAMPMIASGEILFYNKAIFAEVGIEALPTTMDEFYADCELIKAAGYTPIAMGGADAWFSAIPFMTLFQRADVDDEVYTAVCLNNECKFDEPIFVDVANEYVKLSQYMNENPTSIAYGEATAMFENGEAAMIFDGSWNVATYSSLMGEDVGSFNLPGTEGPCAEYLMNYDEGYSIGYNTEHADLCIAFYEIMFGQEMQAKYAENGNLIACQNITYDTSVVPALTNEVAGMFASAESSNIPWDNPLGTNMGSEFNMAVQSILGGADAASTFATLNETAAFEWDN